jgi:hypothetical protein
MHTAGLSYARARKHCTGDSRTPLLVNTCTGDSRTRVLVNKSRGLGEGVCSLFFDIFFWYLHTVSCAVSDLQHTKQCANTRKKCAFLSVPLRFSSQMGGGRGGGEEGRREGRRGSGNVGGDRLRLDQHYTLITVAALTYTLEPTP